MLKANITKRSGIGRDVQDLYNQELNFFRNILKRVVDVLFLATRNLPFRGSEEIFGSVQNGNFMGLLELLSKYDVDMKTHISKLKSKSTHISYMSADIQNELISILAEKVREEIATEIATAKYFTIFFDATPDVRKREQFSECFRFVKCDGLGVSICESFYEFFDTFKKTGEGISNAILEKLYSNGMKIEDCRGQGYDNASNMSGCCELDCLKGSEYKETQKELAWDTAFWFWNRKCHVVAGKGFWAVLSKLSPQDITTTKGEQRLDHYKKVAKGLKVHTLE